MRLSNQQCAAYREKGFVLLPECFSLEEVELMRSQLDLVFSEGGPGLVIEKDGTVIRSVYGSHRTNKVFGQLVRHPKVLEPAVQLLKSDVYVYQFKINAKRAFVGDVWEWHQDFIFWRNEDGLRSPRILSVAIFLDEVTEFNGPMLLIPGSHKEGMIDVTARDTELADHYQEDGEDLDRRNWISNLTADLKYSLVRDDIARLVRRYGIEAPKGPAGSVLFFDGNIAHASSNNISPFDRVVSLVTFNSIENLPVEVENPRPEFLVSRDFSPVIPIQEGAFFS
ncbi:MAG: phytanoyl-CoA dioxygenase [Blastocatellia bacterium AA13]|nr:MAG: phytanoyl-CoA dioxygenase [Blastocatellia bacterium AA13]